MITRDQIIAEAMSWVGTRYHHHQACKGAGADCVGFVLGVAKAIGSVDAGWEPATYSYQWHLHKNEEALVQNLRAVCAHQIPLEAASPGDLIAFRYGRVTSHVGILLPNERLVHAHMEARGVVVTPFAGDLRRRATRAFVFPGVE